MALGDRTRATLSDFAERLGLYNGENFETIEQSIKYSLTGLTDHEEGISEFISLLDYRAGNFDVQEMMAKRDYDSLWGSVSSIKTRSAISVWPVPRFQDSYKKNMGFRAEINDVYITYDQIPNIGFAKFGSHCSIKLFFPGAFNPDAPPGNQVLSHDRLAHIYNHGIRPAVNDLLPEQLAHWPASYDAELRRANRGGGMSLRTLDIGAEVVEEFSSRVIDNLNALHIDTHLWAHNPFYLIQYQNTKGATQHDLGDEYQERVAWEALTEDLDYTENEMIAHFYVDVGIEHTIPDTVLLWYQPQHYRLYREMLGLTGAADRDFVIELVAQSSFQVDRVAHLVDAAGFRARTSARVPVRNPDAPIFNAAYTTDKSNTYTPSESTPAKAITPSDALRSIREFDPNAATPSRTKLVVFYDTLTTIYSDCITSNQPGGARLEGRVEYTQARTWLHDGVSDAVKLNCILVVKDNSLWKYRKEKLTSYFLALVAYSYHKEVLLRPECLTYIAGLVWMINSLQSRPDDRSFCRRLRGTLLAVDPDEEDIINAREPFGAFFISPDAITFEGAVPHIKFEPRIDRSLIAKYFQYTDWEELVAKLLPAQVNLAAERREARRRQMDAEARDDIQGPYPEPVRDNRRSNKRVVAGAPPALAAEDAVVFNLDGLRYALDNAVPRFGGLSVPQTLTESFGRFFVQLLQKAPQTKGASGISYCRLSQHEALDKNNTWLKESENVPLTWRQFQACQADAGLWGTAYARLFPTGETRLPNNHQGFESMTYWVDWRHVCEKLCPEDLELVKEEGKRLFDEFAWVIEPSSDKLYFTGKKPRYKKFEFEGEQKLPGHVTILLNPRMRAPSWFTEA